MDFKRIARILIIAFGLLNFYLIIGIIERQDIQNISSQPTSDTLRNIEDSQIQLPIVLADTDVKNQDIYSIQINANSYLADALNESDIHSGAPDSNGIYYHSFPSNPIILEGNPEDGYTDNDIEKLEKFVYSKEVVFGEEYAFHHFDLKSNRFVFYQTIDNIPIADGTSEISFIINDQGNVISYEQTYAGSATKQGNELQLISGQRAIEILFLNNEIRQGSAVQTPMLSYNRALHLEDLSMYSPVWIINIDYNSERNTFGVDAVNGTIIRQTTPGPDEDNNGNTENLNSEEES